MATTFELIQTFNASPGGSSYADFTSIPNTYTDLRFIVSSRNTDVYNEIHWIINGGTSHKFMYFQGTGSTKQQNYSTNSSTIQGMVQAVSGSPASTFGAGSLYIPYYANTNMSKLVMGYSTQGHTSSFLTGWNTGANYSGTTISSIRAQSSVGNLAEGTKISLFGIKNA
jgi:hypothetical protein